MRDSAKLFFLSPQDEKRLNPFHTCKLQLFCVWRCSSRREKIKKNLPAALRASLSKQPQDGGVDIWIFFYLGGKEGEEKKIEDVGEVEG